MIGLEFGVDDLDDLDGLDGTEGVDGVNIGMVFFSFDQSILSLLSFDCPGSFWFNSWFWRLMRSSSDV